MIIDLNTLKLFIVHIKSGTSAVVRSLIEVLRKPTTVNEQHEVHAVCSACSQRLQADLHTCRHPSLHLF